MNALSFTPGPGRTNIATALDTATDEMFTVANGDRPGDPNYLVMLTDGYSNEDRENTPYAADNARKSGITVFAVGIGKDGCIDIAELNRIANNPDNQYMYVMKNITDVTSIANNVLDMICQT